MTYFDDPRSRRSEELAFLAEQAERRGEDAEARALFTEAAQLEAAAAMAVGANALRVRSAMAMSSVSLALKAEAFEAAASTARQFLAHPELLVPDAASELRALHDRACQT